jgi:hypothetical protein
MAAPKTQGFALSALPEAPRVPQNVGMVDMKAIQDGVRRGLETFEAVRRMPRSMILADAQMAAQTAQAPLETRGLLAQTQGIEQQTPLRTAILAAEASPEMLEAKRQALLNRSTRQASGDVQLASALAAAKQRLAEDPNDAAAAQLVSVLEPMAIKKSAASMADPRAVMEAGLTKAADANAVRSAIATDRNVTQTSIAEQNRASAEARAAAELIAREKIAEAARTQSQTNTEIAARGRVDASRAAYTGKIYETAAQKNEKVKEELAALRVLDATAQEYMDSTLGAGVFVGSSPMIALRSIVGDDTGKNFVAATAMSMKSAVETMRGLGAMSEREFEAAMSQLPKTNEPESAIRLKLDYLNLIRPWMAARNDMFLDRVANGASPMQAHELVRRALPMPVMGSTSSSEPSGTPAQQNLPAPATATPSIVEFQTAAEADAAGAAGTIKPGQRIRVGGQTGTWTPP